LVESQVRFRPVEYLEDFYSRAQDWHPVIGAIDLGSHSAHSLLLCRLSRRGGSLPLTGLYNLPSRNRLSPGQRNYTSTSFFRAVVRDFTIAKPRTSLKKETHGIRQDARSGSPKLNLLSPCRILSMGCKGDLRWCQTL
jgi:hypothetical protein